MQVGLVINQEDSSTVRFVFLAKMAHGCGPEFAASDGMMMLLLDIFSGFKCSRTQAV